MGNVGADAPNDALQLSKPRRYWSRQSLLEFLTPLLAIGLTLGLFRLLNASNDSVYRRYDLLFTTAFDRPPLRLDAKFHDADGDGVADPPADPAEQLQPTTLRFCGVPSGDPAADAKLWKPFVEHLARTTGVPVVYATEVNDLRGQFALMDDKKLHVAALKGEAAPLAVSAHGFAPDALLAADGPYTTKMAIVTAASGTLTEPKHLRGLTLTFTDTTSATGFLAPVVILREEYELAAGRDYFFRFSGGDEQSIQFIAAGERDARKRIGWDAAAVSTDVLDRAVKQGVIKADEFRTILTSPEFPSACFGHMYNLKTSLAAKIRAAFLAFPFAGTELEKFYRRDGPVRFAPVDYKEAWRYVRTLDDSMLRLREQVKSGGR